jgi:hypothetical protein
MSLRGKIFLFCLDLVTVIAAVAASHPSGGPHVLQIKYLQPASRRLEVARKVGLERRNRLSIYSSRSSPIWRLPRSPV